MSGRVGLEGRRAVVRNALGNADLGRVLGAYLLFNVGEWASWIGLLVWGYDVGGVRGSSVIALVQLVPSALLAVPSATLLARLPRGRALAVGYAAQAVAYLAVGVALVTDAPVAVVGVTAVFSSVAVTLTRPVHQALLPEISRTTADLTAGNAGSGSLEAVASLLGPLASALLLAVWGASGVFIAMSVCSLVGAALTARLVTAPPAPSVVRRDRGGRGESALATVVRSPAARLMSLLIAAEYVLVGMMDILLVVLALDVLGMSHAGPGILNSAIGVGGLIGAALTFTLIGRSRLSGPVLLGALCAGLAFALAGQAPTPVLAAALVAVSGGGKLFYDVSSRTFVQRLLPDRLLTAMFGLQESLTMTGLALGSLAAPLLVELVGVRAAFLAAGCLLPLAAAASYRTLRRLDAAAAVPTDVLALLMQVPTLAVLAPRIVERMARDAVGEHVTAGSRVVGQGEIGTRFYVIAEGHVSVDIDGSEIRRLGPGDWFGEIALLRDVPRTASVTALTEVSLWGIDQDSFLASVAAVPHAVQLADSHIRDRYV